MADQAAAERIVIIGGGITGLTAAYRLRQKSDCPLTLIESRDRIGGVIESRALKINNHDYMIESGADSFITNKPYALNLASDLGIQSEIVRVNSDGGGALVLKDGVLHRVPDGFVMLAPSKFLPFACSPVISLKGKMRALLEPFLPARRSSEEESLASFVRRRFGREVLEGLAQPMVAGVYVGDAEKLSADEVAGRFVDMERTSGSVIAGLLKVQEKSSGARYGLFASFKGGLGHLCQTLLEKTAALDLLLSSPVTKVEGKPGRFIIRLASGQEIVAGQVILAIPARQAAALLDTSLPKLALALAEVESASSAVVNFVFARQDLKQLESRVGRTFGAVIPARERAEHNLDIMAFSFASNKYPHRAPQDHVVVRAFLGGVGQSHYLDKSDDELVQLALKDLRKILPLPESSGYIYKSVHRWPVSMPQYNLGHRLRIDKIEKLAEEAGLYLAGASYAGVGIPDCIKSAEACVKKLIDSNAK